MCANQHFFFVRFSCRPHKFVIIFLSKLFGSIGRKCVMLGMVNVDFITNTYLYFRAHLLLLIILTFYTCRSMHLPRASFMSCTHPRTLLFVFLDLASGGIFKTDPGKQPRVAGEVDPLGHIILTGEYLLL